MGDQRNRRNVPAEPRGRADPSFLVGVEFRYEPRADAFSDYRAGFEIRGSLRCRTIRIATRAADGVVRVSREYRFTYEQAPFNGASLLTQIEAMTHTTGMRNGRNEP
jgi:hypothetical protein